MVKIHKAEDAGSEPNFIDNHDEAITSLSCSVSFLVDVRIEAHSHVALEPRHRLAGQHLSSILLPSE